MNASAPDTARDTDVRIRPVDPSDRAPLLAILRATGVFNDEELAIALELIDIVLEQPAQRDYVINVCEEGTRVTGYYCVGPTPATVGTFDLYWIAVDPALHGRGFGSRLMRHAEEFARGRQGRLIIVETSSRPSYEPTRRFYLSNGYAELARIAGYYRRDDDLVVFGKYVSQ